MVDIDDWYDDDARRREADAEIWADDQQRRDDDAWQWDQQQQELDDRARDDEIDQDRHRFGDFLRGIFGF